jgi:hypothetical protein
MMLKVIRYHIIFIDKPKNKRRIEMETLVPIKEERIKVNDIIVPDKKAIVRTDTNDVLSIVSNNYQVFKHEDVIEGV